MRGLKGFLATVLLAGASAVNAAPVTWTDTIDFNPDRYIGWWGSSSYTHDIRDDGFTAGVSSVAGYQLVVDLYDDDGSIWDLGEIALINVPGIIGDSVEFNLSGSEGGGWSIAGFLNLTFTGLFNVTVTSLFGDFYLGGSTLQVWGDDGRGTNVPEPMSLGLMGLGLLGAAAFARKQKKA